MYSVQACFLFDFISPIRYKKASLQEETVVSQLQQVREQLRANHELVWIGEDSRRPTFPHDKGGWHEFIFLVVGLKKPDFNLEELERRRRTLVTGVEPEPHQFFRRLSHGVIELGTVCFSEEVGTITYQVTDEEYLQAVMADKRSRWTLTDGSLTQEMERRVLILLLPSVEMGQQQMERIDRFSVEESTWREFELAATLSVS